MSARALVLAVALGTGCAAWKPVPLPERAERHRPKTPDGWELALTRYKAEGPVKGLPVLLCHGISANDRNMDLDEEHSMARWFAKQGRDAWTISLRGTGTSDAKGPISFDDYWRSDLPTAIAYVKQVSQAAAVDYAGHSMGGIVVYAYLSQGGGGLNAVTTLGSPTRLDWGTSLDGVLAALPDLVGPTWSIPGHAGAFLAAPFQRWADDGPFQRLFYNPQSTKVETWQRLMAWGTAATAGGTARQLGALARGGSFVSADGTLDFRAGMAGITTPVLVVAARLDRIALATSVKDGFRALGGPKEWLLITRANGALGEYGHMDLVVGERAADEVWSKVLAFFDRHARKEP